MADKRKQRGQSLVEYALILALVSVAGISALQALSSQVGGTFEGIIAGLDSATTETTATPGMAPPPPPPPPMP